MSTMATLVIFCTLAIGSLVAVSIVNQRQRRTKVVRQKLKQLKRRVDALEDMVSMLDQLTESRAIPKFINDEATDLLRAMVKLDENSSYLEARLHNADQRSDELSHESASRQLNRLQESDVQIARVQQCLNEAGKILRLQCTRGHITTEELETFIKELAWTHLQVSIISLIGHGHKAFNKGDFSTAHAFYKKAQHMLIQSKHPDPRRERMIKEVSELLTRRRASLSTDLMPEVQYNPSEY